MYDLGHGTISLFDSVQDTVISPEQIMLIVEKTCFGNLNFSHDGESR